MLEMVYRHYCRRFKAYQSFERKEALNDSVRLFASDFHMDLTDASRKVLKLLAAKSSNGVLGVSWMKKETISEKAGISESSVERAIRFLVAAGILKKYHENRKRGSRHVVLVIQPYQGNNFFADDDGLNDGLSDGLQHATKQPEKPCVARDSGDDEKRHNSSFISNLQSNSLNDTKSEQETVSLNVKQTENFAHLNSVKAEDKEKFALRNVPDYFKESIRTVVSVEQMKRLWEQSLICMRECRAKFLPAYMVEEAWNTTFKIIKQKKMQGKDEIALYYGILRNLYRDQIMTLSMSDWNKYSELFYTHKKKHTYPKKYAGYKRVITEHARKMIGIIMERHNISYEQAQEYHFSIG